MYTLYKIYGPAPRCAYYGYLMGDLSDTEVLTKFLASGHRQDDASRGASILLKANGGDESKLRVEILDYRDDEGDARDERNRLRVHNYDSVTGASSYPPDVGRKTAKNPEVVAAMKAAKLNRERTHNRIHAKTARQYYENGGWHDTYRPAVLAYHHKKKWALLSPGQQNALTTALSLPPAEFAAKYGLPYPDPLLKDSYQPGKFARWLAEHTTDIDQSNGNCHDA